MTLENIDVFDLEAFKTGLDRIEDVLTDPRVRAYWAISFHPEELTLRERPWRLMYPFSSGFVMNPSAGVFATAKKTYKAKT